MSSVERGGGKKRGYGGAAPRVPSVDQAEIGVDFDNLFENLMKVADDHHRYNHMLAKILTSLGQNNFHLHDGIAYVYDTQRGHLVSTARMTIHAGKDGLGVTNTSLRIAGIPMQGKQGVLIPRKASITAAYAKSRNNSNWSLEIRRNGNPISICSVPISGGRGSRAGLDVELQEGDWLQLYVAGTNVEHPMASVEIAWRQ
jgi:hypothetical protein